MAKQTDQQLQAQLDAAYRRKVEELLRVATKRLTLEAFTRVVARSPVDTGRFRGNWQVGVGTRPDGIVATATSPGRQPGDAVREPIPASGAETGEALAAVAALNERIDKTYVVNNLPYAEALENGHSGQAPTGMVAVTVEELRGLAGRVAQQAGR